MGDTAGQQLNIDVKWTCQELSQVQANGQRQRCQLRNARLCDLPVVPSIA